ncbi:MAG: glycosyltransferase family 4 protein [Bdellovibrionales bacterium]|nr:glycosyltransferase family 4 protein [Bdellovibrionales bacterium]
MRILFFSHYYPPENNAPAVRTAAHCRAWAAEGHDVTVVTCAPNHPRGELFPGYKNKFFQQETVDGVKVVRVYSYLAANEGTFRRILNFVSYMVSAVVASFFLRRADVVIATSPQFFCGWAGVFARLIHRAPFILEIRDIWPESIVAVGAMKNRFIIRLLETLERIMYWSATKIVTVGKGYKSQLCARGVPEKKISIVYNGADLDLFQQGDPAEFALPFPSTVKFICTYVGTVGMAHGLSVALEAALKLREEGRSEIGFAIVGDGAERSNLEAEARRLGLSNVVFTGQVPRTAIPSILRQSSCCLVHLKNTQLFTTVIPSKIFEMLAAEKPIIIGVRGEAREIVEAANAGVFMTPGSATELATIAAKLSSDSELLARLGSSGKSFVEQEFSREHFANEYLHLIESLSRRGSGRRRKVRTQSQHLQSHKLHS